MGCGVSREQLWSWVDRDAAELEAHLAECPECRARAAEIRGEIDFIGTSSPASVPLPDKINPYTVLGLLGEGGQALVFEAEQPSPRRAVALKVLKGGHLADRRQVKYFHREIQTLANLKHQGIATVFEAGRTQEGLHYLAMELVDGVRLDEYMLERKPPPRDCLELFRKLCNAVEHAHRQGVIHRDLKPGNIMVDQEGNPKILDFGLARLTSPGSELTVTVAAGAAEGTPRYMSPEQAGGQHRDVGVRSDIYSLGVILYEMMTGRPPHDLNSVTPEALRVISEVPPPRPSGIDRRLHGDLETVILKTLEKDPERRYQAVSDLVEDIRRVLAKEPIKAKPVGWPRRTQLALRRNLGWTIAGALALAGLIAALWFATRAPYDMMRARSQLIGLHCALLEGDADGAVHGRAIAAPGRYPGLAEAVLVAAHSKWWSGKPDIRMAIDLLEMEFEKDTTQWSYPLMISELCGDHQTQRTSKEVLPEVTPPDDADAWYLRSFATVRPDHALECARTAVQRDSTHIPALDALAKLSLMQGDSVGAVEVARKLASWNVDRTEWTLFAGELLRWMGLYKDAEREYSKAIEQYPRHPSYWFRRAQIRRLSGQHRDALDDFNRAIELAGSGRNSAWMYLHRAITQCIVGNPEAAVEDYRTARRLMTHATYADVRLYLLLRDLGREAEAADALARARPPDPADNWLGTIHASLAGEITPQELVAAADLANPMQVCEAYYYAGELERLDGRHSQANEYFHLCVGTGFEVDRRSDRVDPMSEYELARWRLGLPLGINRDTPPAKPANSETVLP